VLFRSLARRAGSESVFGAFIDSTVDRVAEIAVFGALIMYFFDRGPGGRLAAIVCLVALTGSFLTSYTRARAEGLGFECKVGWLERPERVALLIIGLLCGGAVLLAVLWFLALFTMVTALQRVLHVRRLTAAKDRSAS
jgi:CDP-diacylglycerol--glycerol-3-phosphate 3-phosphatidyltransferase